MGEGEHAGPSEEDLTEEPDPQAPFKVNEIVIFRREVCQTARFVLKLGPRVYLLRRVARIWRSRESETGWKMIAHRYTRRGRISDPALSTSWYQAAFNERGDPTF